jgi:hypothetical protein
MVLLEWRWQHDLGAGVSRLLASATTSAMDDPSGSDFEPGVEQNWAQFFVSENQTKLTH